MIEGFGSGSGSINLINGFGSPKPYESYGSGFGSGSATLVIAEENFFPAKWYRLSGWTIGHHAKGTSHEMDNYFLFFCV
jgi:hypothetical protein